MSGKVGEHGRRNHGERNLTNWQRMSRRQRERVQRGQDLGTMLGHMEQTMLVVNRLVLRVEALETVILAKLHDHPTVTADGIAIITNGATPPRAFTLADLEAAFEGVRQRYLEDERNRQLAAAAEGEAPAQSVLPQAANG